MSTQNQHHRLLISIKELYSKVALRALHARMHSNNKTFKSNHHQDISEQLTRHIEHLTNIKEQNNKNNEVSQISKRYMKINESSEADNNRYNKNKRISSVIYDELSKYFKTNNTHDTQQPFVGDRLKKSAWIHIHAALRLARQGDKKSAKLHADIANSALKEASHFMPVEEYKIFCEQVTDALSEIKS